MKYTRVRASGNHIAGQYKSHNSIVDLTLSDLYWLVLLNLSLFGNAIQGRTGFTYIDETVTLLLLAGAVFCSLRRKRAFSEGIRQLANWAIACLAALAFVGLLGNIVYGYQVQFAPIAIDMFTCLKFPIALLSSILVFRQRKQLFLAAETEAKILSAIVFIFGCINIFADIGMSYEIRYGLRSYKFIFDHPTYLVFFNVGLISLLLVDWKENVFWICLDLLATALSLRSKGFGYVAIVAISLVIMRNKQKLTPAKIAAICGIGIAIGWNQFFFYFNTPGYARGELTSTAILIARQSFPLGGGFATFGSAVTADPNYYSPLYYLYGLANIWGLEPDNILFISDTFWPVVLGEFGFLGLGLYVSALGLLMLICYRIGPTVRIATLTAFGYLLISSTSESTFFNPQAICLAMCLGLMLFNGQGDVVARRGNPEKDAADE